MSEPRLFDAVSPSPCHKVMWVKCEDGMAKIEVSGQWEEIIVPEGRMVRISCETNHLGVVRQTITRESGNRP